MLISRPNSYPVVVGAGGGAGSNWGSPGLQGSDSSLGTLVAKGGGLGCHRGTPSDSVGGSSGLFVVMVTQCRV